MEHEDVTLHEVERSVWWGWGDPAEAKPLPDSAKKHLAQLIGPTQGQPPVALSSVAMPAVRLTDEALAHLRSDLGEENVRIDALARMGHAGGKSYVDLARARAGIADKAPDTVLFPRDEREIEDIFARAIEHGFCIIPFGGGTSVVAGLSTEEDAAERPRPVVSLDMRRLSGLLELDEISATARFAAGTRAFEAERALRDQGWTLGHYPQSYQQATIGGFVATRSAGQSSSGFGRIDDMVTAVRAVTPTGVASFGDRSPATAAGPRLVDVLVGSEGSFGVITDATLRIQRASDETTYAAYSFPTFADAAAALREITHELGHDAQPDVTRVSDAAETEVSLALAGGAGAALTRYLKVRGHSAPCLGIFLWHGQGARDLRRRSHAAGRIMARHGAVALPQKVARGWEHGRFSAPYLRDELMGAGVFVETLETATRWTNLEHLYEGVQAAISEALQLQGTPGIVECHISHVYHSGASLYYTFIAPEAADRLAQWQLVKEAASNAIVEHGGTITHHHAVGRDHRPFLKHEIGDVGVRMLRALKEELDPQNILNPGALVELDQ